MITIGEMQISGMLVMGLLAITLAWLVPGRSVRHSVFGRARWLMVAGLALMSVQFLLQRTVGFRQMGVTQGVLCNLLFFMPSCTCINQAILYLQRQGRLTPTEWSAGWVGSAVTTVVLLATTLLDGLPLQADSKPLRLAEYACAAVFIIVHGFYFINLYKEYQRMKSAVSEYYDRERDDLMRWMDFMAKMLAVGALFLPLVVFAHANMLMALSVFYFFSVYYCTISFYRYGISPDSQRVTEAQESRQDDEAEAAAADGKAQQDGRNVSAAPAFTIADADRQRVERAAMEWVAAGNALKPNLTLTTVATGMGVQRYLLKAWLQSTEWGKLSRWLNHLRTEEAKRLIAQHPEWGFDVVATHCGFTTRNYFHQVFLEQTGMTPAKYLKKMCEM